MPSRQIGQTLKFLFLLLLAGFSADAAEIVLRSKCSCDKAYVTLHDIADIRLCSPEEAEQLAAVQLLPSPSTSRTRVLRVREVQELLALQGIDVEDLRFRGASRVELGGGDPGFTSASLSDTSTEAGSRQAVVARRPIGRGEIIRAQDVMLKTIYSPFSERDQLLGDLDDAVGMETTRALTEGQMIDSGMLRRPMMVRRLANVTVYVRVGGIQVATKARALGDGALDDIVTVELIDDRQKKLSGRVIGLDELEVFAQGAAVDPVQMRPLPATRPKTTPQAAHEQNPQITRKN